ncbi:xylulose kinase isoform X2 [Syngnathus scovelli]|uniref:xylulose kinase isoform X2 n=1 Tax=Syngnathus scovelli TaxID=161590 RepID=UPI00211054EE|nr:xylulose kinase isoform X2 [Syngnathus scovelli]
MAAVQHTEAYLGFDFSTQQDGGGRPCGCRRPDGDIARSNVGQGSGPPIGADAGSGLRLLQGASVVRQCNTAAYTGKREQRRPSSSSTTSAASAISSKTVSQCTTLPCGWTQAADCSVSAWRMQQGVLSSWQTSRAPEPMSVSQEVRLPKCATNDRESSKIPRGSHWSAALRRRSSSAGSGMNLLDIRSKKWNEALLEAVCPGLDVLLGKPMPSASVLGAVSSYWVRRFGFSDTCAVVAFTGDNPASLAGMRLQQGDLAVSLGTSDTVFVWLQHARPALEGHVFINPVDWRHFMGLLCFKNGSLTRERLRNRCADSSWERFSTALRQTPLGNNGYIGLYFDVMEITPRAVGVHLFDAEDNKVSSVSAEAEVRALVEGQFLSRRLHAERLGYSIIPGSRILATGGASCNKEILQVLCDVFNAPVYTMDVSNSACLGSAYRALHGVLDQSDVSFFDVTKEAPEARLATTPQLHAHQVYNEMLQRYGRLEKKVLQELRS